MAHHPGARVVPQYPGDACIGRLAAAHYGWTIVPFMKDGAERALEEKHEEIFSIIRSAL